MGSWSRSSLRPRSWSAASRADVEDSQTVDLAAIRKAREVIAGGASRTPLVRLNLPGSVSELYLKLENLQPIGSFKIRGAANRIAHMSQADLERGVVSASAGNLAQRVA